MLIDGFTIAAQVINFLILVILLKKFLYGPIIRAMEERENRIKTAVDQAELARIGAKAQAQALALEKKAFSEEKSGLMADAKKEIERWREKKIEDLRREINLLYNTWIDKVDQERDAFLVKLQQDAIRHIMHIAEKVLKDLAAQDLQERVIKVFMENIQRRANGFQGLHYGGSPRVISGFELSEIDIQEIDKILRQKFPSAQNTRFEVSEKLGMGIEIMAGDKKTAWNLEKYLVDLEKEILPALPSKDHDDI